MIRPKPADIAIIALVLLAAAALLVPGKARGTKAILYRDGEVLREFDLSRDEVYTVSADYDNVIVVENGAIRIDSAGCPDKVCVHSGAISKAGQTVCCLPNKLIIRIVGSSAETDVISE